MVEITSSPGESNLIIPSIAASPLEKQSPYLPFSREARFFSSAFLVGLPVLEYSPDRDKVARVNASTPILESGRVYVPNKPFAKDLIDEATSFPNAAHDDQVDAMVMAILYLKESWKVDHPLDAYLINDFSDEPEPKRVGYWSF